MTPGARVSAAIGILDSVLAGQPAEKALTTWARRSRFAGAKDRTAVRDHVFDALRRRDSYAWLGGSLTGRGLMLGQVVSYGQALDAVFSGQGHAPPPVSATEAAALGVPEALPAAVARDMPDWIVERLRVTLGPDVDAVCAALRDRAPVHLRVNLAKTTRDAAKEALAEAGYPTEDAPLAQAGLTVLGSARGLDRSAPFLAGFVELQDAASQAAVDALGLEVGQRALDYCAGGGGKALAMAALGARVTCHDAVPARMRDLPGRAHRAGAEITLADAAALARTRPFDIVFVDAPCSGSGAWRRTPDAKWRLRPEQLAALCATQAAILAQAVPLTAPQGVLAYATCSLLPDENHGQVAAFLRSHPDWALLSEHVFTPLEGGDGFYLARLQRKKAGAAQPKVER